MKISNKKVKATAVYPSGLSQRVTTETQALSPPPLSRLRIIAPALCGAFTLAIGLGAISYRSAPPVYASEKTRTASAPVVDPAAVAALSNMGNYLRTLRSFQVHAVASTDDVLKDGEKVQNNSDVDLMATLPDRLRATVTGDQVHRAYIYDGKTFTLYGKLINYYATVPAPSTVGATVDELEARYSIDLPLADLFKWGTAKTSAEKITGAFDVGQETVHNDNCEHYAFRQAGLDWQIWIQQGPTPLPLKLVLTTLTDEARPQHEAVLTWNLAPTFDADTFAFNPPADAHKIKLTEAISFKQKEGSNVSTR